ncbi:MAG: hypothetical protein KCHDKBKB_01225 [Elusimicrobia bacterium]|nr:hypothetical protein [Elusimicrobiota bacterium]
MILDKETKWLCENAKNLEKYSGHWVVFSAREGLMSDCVNLADALKMAKNKKSKSIPFLLHVPSKEELVSPLPVATKK